MDLVSSAKDLLSLTMLVWAPFRLHGHDRDQEAFGIAQRDLVTGGNAARELAGYIQGNRHRPQGAVGQMHRLDYLMVVVLVQKAFKWGETAVQQQLDVAQLPLGEIPRAQIDG